MKKILFILSCIWFSVNLGWLYWDELDNKNISAETDRLNPVYQERTYDVVFKEKKMASLVYSSSSNPVRQVWFQLSINLLWNKIRQKLNIEVSAYADSGNVLSRFFITVWNTSKKEKINLSFFGRVTDKEIKINLNSSIHQFSFNIPIEKTYNYLFLFKFLFKVNADVDCRKMILLFLNTIKERIQEIKSKSQSYFFLDYAEEILKIPPRIIMSKFNEILEIRFRNDFLISEADIILDYKPYYIEITQDKILEFMLMLKPLYVGTVWGEFFLNKT